MAGGKRNADFCRFRLSSVVHHHNLHGRKDLNPQPTVLETVALPIELRPYFTPLYNAEKLSTPLKGA